MYRGLHSTAERCSQFVVCGAGAGGLAVASRLTRKFGEGKVTIVDPAQVSTSCTLCMICTDHRKSQCFMAERASTFSNPKCAE